MPLGLSAQGALLRDALPRPSSGPCGGASRQGNRSGGVAREIEVPIADNGHCGGVGEREAEVTSNRFITPSTGGPRSEVGEHMDVLTFVTQKDAPAVKVFSLVGLAEGMMDRTAARNKAPVTPSP
jgi:hypothetical protein